MDAKLYRGFKGSVVELSSLINAILVNPNRELRSHEEEHYDRDLSLVRDEGYPLVIFLEHNFFNVNRIEIPDSSNTNFDAQVSLIDGTSIYVEVTGVKDGELELYRAKYLDMKGHAAITGVTTQGFFDALNDKTEYWGEASEVGETIKSLVLKISETVDKKCNKHYQPGTILLVAINDDFRADTFERIVSLLKFPAIAPFRSIYLVSINTKKAHVIT